MCGHLRDFIRNHQSAGSNNHSVTLMNWFFVVSQLKRYKKELQTLSLAAFHSKLLCPFLANFFFFLPLLANFPPSRELGSASLRCMSAHYSRN